MKEEGAPSILETEAIMMQTSRRAVLGTLAVFLALGAAAAPEPAATDAQVTLRDIKYDDLGKLVRGYKGKVVVVDFWRED
jgi:hypothetical protein